MNDNDDNDCGMLKKQKSKSAPRLIKTPAQAPATEEGNKDKGGALKEQDKDWQSCLIREMLERGLYDWKRMRDEYWEYMNNQDKEFLYCSYWKMMRREFK